MKYFQAKRYHELLRYEVLTNYRAYIKLFLIVTGVLLGFATFLCDLSNLSADYPCPVRESGMLPLLWIIVCAVAFFTMCESFTHIRHTPNRMHYLLIPASRSEKFLQSLTVKTLAAFGVPLLSVVTADVLHILIQLVMWGETESMLVCIKRLWPSLEDFGAMRYFSIFCCFVLTAHAYAVFVSAFIRKATKIAAPLLLFALGWALWFLMYCGYQVLVSNHLYVTVNFKNENALLLFLDVCAIVLSAALYAAAYWKFGRLQIRNSRFFN